jgi:hypothetical protein
LMRDVPQTPNRHKTFFTVDYSSEHLVITLSIDNVARF